MTAQGKTLVDSFLYRRLVEDLADKRKLTRENFVEAYTRKVRESMLSFGISDAAYSV